MTSMLPLPVLVTARLELTPLVLDDAEPMAAVLADPQMYEFIGGQPPDVTELRRRYTVLATYRSPDGSEWWLNWIVRDRVTRAPVGVVQATVSGDRSHAWVAWEIGVAWQGERRATEAAAAMTDWLTGAGVGVIEADPGRPPRFIAAGVVATPAGLALPHVIEGSIVVESVFSWPGIGQLTVASVGRRDYPILLAITLLIGLGILLSSLLTDLLYGWLDPRIGYE